ncbi:MAG: aldehyde dehydrogenase family protein, partial [Candidatus Dormiibacterota bacterium]
MEATGVRTYGNLIAGEWQAAAQGETFESLNPARRGDVLGHFAKGGPRDIDLAVRGALAAQPEWARTPVPA